MASWITFIISYLRPAKSDLSISQQILAPLPLQPSTKNFTLALRDPENPSSIVYILATVILSEQSASDAQDLIKILKPQSVIVQAGYDSLQRPQVEMQNPQNSNEAVILPTSVVHVIKESFLDGHDLGKYMKVAETEVLKAIFGTSFTGHAAAAKKAAAETKSTFYYLEGPVPSSSLVAGDSQGGLNRTDGDDVTPGVSSKNLVGSSHRTLQRHSGSKMYSIGLPLRHFPIPSSLQDSMRNTLASLGFNEQFDDSQSVGDPQYNCPAFAQSFYPLLADLCNEYKDLPGLTLALQRTQKLLRDVESGKHVNSEELALSQCFRLAMEGLRFSINAAALGVDKSASSKDNFDDLSYNDKCHAILAQALKHQARESGTVVAVLDAESVAGIRKHWMTTVPDHVSLLAKECLLEAEDNRDLDDEGDDGVKKKSKLLDKPIVVVSAGAAAAAGVASISHVGPVSTAMKIVTLKIPTMVKLALIQTKRGAVVAMSKLLSPVSNLMVPSATKGLGTSKLLWLSKPSVLNAAGSGWKLQTAAHSVIATAEKASFNAIRTTFYNVMRNRTRKSLVGRPWLSFGASVTACVGLLTFGDRIENTIQAIPEASSIAHLGRGVKSLYHASEALKQTESTQHWETLYRKLYGLLNRT